MENEAAFFMSFRGQIPFSYAAAFHLTHAYPMIALSTVQTLKKIKMETEDPSPRYGLYLSRLHLLSFPLVSMSRKSKHKLFKT